jgi:adenosyl cobinamide kinase/adenosyl cobinamide phosphate guanylyltransferase
MGTVRPVIVLVLGGTRSGKSEVAERFAGGRPQPVTYVATGWADPDADPDLAARIAAHRQRRPPDWLTIESGVDLIGALRAYPEGTMVVDSLGSWVAEHPDLAVDIGALCAALRDRTGDTVLVSDEVGLSVHPPTDAGRRFVDVMGEVNRAVAGLADDALLVVAGRVVPLGPPSVG